MRHTSRTDPEMDGDRSQISVRLNRFYRERLREVAEDHHVPDVHTIADIVQDAIWLWFHEYDLDVEKGRMPNARGGTGRGARKARPPMGAGADDPVRETQGVEVGSPAAAGQALEAGRPPREVAVPGPGHQRHLGGMGAVGDLPRPDDPPGTAGADH